MTQRSCGQRVAIPATILRSGGFETPSDASRVSLSRCGIGQESQNEWRATERLAGWTVRATRLCWGSTVRGDLLPFIAAVPDPSASGETLPTPATAALHATVFDAAVIGAAVIAPDGRWLLVNRVGCQVLGYTDTELAATSYQALTLPADRAVDVAHFTDLALGQAPPYQIERQLVAKSGLLRWVRLSLARAIGPGGEALGVVANLEDIEARRDSEASASSSLGELQRSNSELEVFAAVAAHDLQEPLRKIRTFGDRLDTRFGAALGVDGANYLHRMQASAARMQNLIDDLLTYACISTRGQPFEAVDLNLTMAEVTADLEARLEETSGRLTVGQLPTVDADPLQMRQLFQNLIANALKFVVPGRSPIVTVEANARKSPSGATVTVSVRDNGIGFESVYASRIFEPFERLHGKSEYEGTGIGLAICLRIAERHRGSIVAESTPGDGSVFSLTLPARDAPS